MGFRSTFCTQDYSIEWPLWFKEKYHTLCFDGGISSSREYKKYGNYLGDLDEDIQKALNECGFGDDNFILVYLHECGGITRVQIEKDKIYYSEPTYWELTKGATHSGCYECSDIPPAGRVGLE